MKTFVKRQPVALITGAATLVATLAYVAPSMGVPLPSSVQKGIGIGMLILAGLGIHPAVTPIAAPNLGKK